MIPRASDRFYLLVLVLLAGPFYLNDFASIFVTDWRLWLLVDYVAVKLLPLAIVLWVILGKRMHPAELGLARQSVPAFVVVFLVVALVGTVIDQNAYRWLAGLPGYAPLGAMPAIESRAWEWIDLTLGLLLVGVVEELVFRGYMHAFLRRYTRSPAAIVLVSGVAFGLIHWSVGLHAVLVTTIIGIVLMVAYMRTRALPAIMLAHFAINFVDFSGVVPKSVFKLF